MDISVDIKKSKGTINVFLTECACCRKDKLCVKIAIGANDFCKECLSILLTEKLEAIDEAKDIMKKELRALKDKL